MAQRLNIADRLRKSAHQVPTQRAVVFPHSRDDHGRVSYTHLTFAQLDAEVDRVARGLVSMGVRPGHRLVLMVRPSLEFIALTFGIFRSGAVCTLIDPGMGKSHVFRCLDSVTPDGFVAIPIVHAVRRLMVGRYRTSRFNVTVGPRRGLFGNIAYPQLLQAGDDPAIELPETSSTDAAAIIFTSGSTGPPKGVHYEHGMFDAQVDLIRDRFGIEAGETDLPGFPLFALFNLAMQVTTVIPDMDPTRPADVDPVRIIEAIEDNDVTQAFGSPALWNTVGRYCDQHAKRLPTLRRILSAGAPVPNHILERMTRTLADEADIFTPYGATECLPVAAIGGRQVLAETATLTADGAGTCVGTVFDQMEVKIIESTFDPIETIDQATQLQQGEIGEIIVRGPVATREYFCRPDATALAKIKDDDTFWHRMGDVGYFDQKNRLWFCGRKAHIVFTSNGPLYSVRCEAIFNQHANIYRTALVGIGERGHQTPVIVAEPESLQFPNDVAAEQQMIKELLQLGRNHPLTADISHVILHKSLPVDTRHNIKINREQLAVWAAGKVSL